MSVFLNTALFMSTHVNRIDGKGRISFPATFRSALVALNSQGVVIFRSPAEPAIEGVTIERMKQMSDALESYPPFDPRRTAIEHGIFGTAQELVIDREGRCSLPKSLLDQIGITTDAAFLGRGSTFQIWEPGALAAEAAKAADALRSGAVSMPVLQRAP